MIPMLAWIAREAPLEQKATYFAVMAAFTNLALSASSLGTNYLNEIFVVGRGQYGELGKTYDHCYCHRVGSSCCHRHYSEPA